MYLIPKRLLRCFNPQPPKGGWVPISSIARSHNGFNTQPPKGGWILFILNPTWLVSFNTQPPKGGWASNATFYRGIDVSTHSRLKAAGQAAFKAYFQSGVSTHSRLKAAGRFCVRRYLFLWRFNTQPPKGGWTCTATTRKCCCWFQHTAA